MTVGSLKSPEVHAGNLVNAQALEKGYFESGLVIHNILRMNTFNIGYFGVGVGAFYRYGPYQYPIERANWAFKLAMMYSINYRALLTVLYRLCHEGQLNRVWWSYSLKPKTIRFLNVICLDI